MIDDVKTLLLHYEYTPLSSDDGYIQHQIDSVSREITSYCHTSIVPPALCSYVTDVAAARFLLSKYTSGQFDIDSEDITQISEGDTSITYSQGMSRKDLYLNTLKEKSTLDYLLLQRWRKL
ncbi:phage head-tail connector protein [Candidatus Methanomassiliicoccus intestinalis]|jgi:hypothetical protein|uniref:Tail connector protein n=1 Tax=Siphoviridae sp. ctedO8 TaxID=2827907 RepID=A0A8S5T3V4_9CAUD|nr:MAG TPA: tail connector protein [Siphoviridae sp. ctedO8]